MTNRNLNPDVYDKEQVGFSLPEHLVDDLDKIAMRTHNNRSRVLAMILQDYFYLIQHHVNSRASWTAEARIEQWQGYRNKPNTIPPRRRLEPLNR